MKNGGSEGYSAFIERVTEIEGAEGKKKAVKPPFEEEWEQKHKMKTR